jgi:formate hydrogenlyase subunit 6/NADH:ubiquinone oxidoreductase subunit I
MSKIVTKQKVGKMVHAVLQSLLKRPATLNYPAQPSPMPEHFRGKLTFYPERCTGCKLCMRDCPAHAIKITRISKTEIEAEIDLAKCIYCGQCVDSCPRGALEMTREFELAQLSRDKLKITFRTPPPEEPEAGEPKPEEEK